MDRADKLDAMAPAFWDGLAPVFAAIDADAEARCVVRVVAFRSGGPQQVDLVATWPVEPPTAAGLEAVGWNGTPHPGCLEKRQGHLRPRVAEARVDGR